MTERPAWVDLAAFVVGLACLGCAASLLVSNRPTSGVFLGLGGICILEPLWR